MEFANAWEHSFTRGCKNSDEKPGGGTHTVRVEYVLARSDALVEASRVLCQDYCGVCPMSIDWCSGQKYTLYYPVVYPFKFCLYFIESITFPKYRYLPVVNELKRQIH